MVYQYRTQPNPQSRISLSRETTPTIGSNTPWGPAQTVETLAPGVVLVSTASHGGVWVTPDLDETIPARVRKIAREYAPEGWYEEDDDIVIPLVWLPGIHVDTVSTALRHAMWSPRMAPLVRALEARDIQRQTPEHPFVPVHGQTGCARCGFAKGHHPNATTRQFRQHQADDPHCTCNDCIGVLIAEADIHGANRERRI